MTYYYVGDIPHEVLTVLPELNGVPQELHGNDTAEVTATNPSGTEITTLTAEVQGNAIDVTFPETSIFTEAGIYTIVCVIDHTEHHATVAATQVDPVRIVADDTSAEWATLAITRSQWIDSRTIDDDVLYEILQVAKTQVLDFAPALAEAAAVLPTTVWPKYRRHAISTTDLSWTQPMATSAPTRSPFAHSPWTGKSSSYYAPGVVCR